MFNFPHLPAKVRRMTLCVSPGGLWRSASRPKHTAAEWRVKTAAAIILLSTVPTPAVARRALMRRPSMLHATVLFPASPRQKKCSFALEHNVGRTTGSFTSLLLVLTISLSKHKSHCSDYYFFPSY